MLFKNGCDILHLEWASSGRDVDIVEPVLCYLELKGKTAIVRESIANAPFKILKYWPRMLVLANGIGAQENVDALEFASRLGIKTASFVSEGDYPERAEGVDQLFWGWNIEREFYEDLRLEWTQRNLELIGKHVRSSSSFNIKVSGATGFDKYSLFCFADKKGFLRKYNKGTYSKVVGIAGWCFDLLVGEYYEEHRDFVHSWVTNEDLELHRKALPVLRSVLSGLIAANRDILFVLKEHPGMVNMSQTEFFGLGDFDNTLTIRREENIADVINSCDMWIAYESTSCLEAWLLGKQTMLINPLGGGFKRSQISLGSPIKKSIEEAQASILCFYQTHHVPGFKSLSTLRDGIIEQTIQWRDGKNHIRAGELILELLDKRQRKKARINSFVAARLLKSVCTQILLWSGLLRLRCAKGRFSNIRYLMSVFDSGEREAEHQKYLHHLSQFYRKSGIAL